MRATCLWRPQSLQVTGRRLDGVSFTTGIELMLSADVVVAADDGRLALIELGRGVTAAYDVALRVT
jgi:enoyl-CoA hydratase